MHGTTLELLAARHALPRLGIVEKGERVIIGRLGVVNVRTIGSTAYTNAEVTTTAKAALSISRLERSRWRLFRSMVRRIDALRGTVAVERGPLVYCFEQADQPEGVDLEDLAVQLNQPADQASELDSIGSTVVIAAGAVYLPSAAGGPAYLDNPAAPGADPAGAQVVAVAIPYFQWDNRDGRAMRIWMPLAAQLPATDTPC